MISNLISRETKVRMRKVIPFPLLRVYWNLRLSHLRKVNGKKSLKEVFTEIYIGNGWGGRGGEYCSGAGSSEYHALPYARAIRNVIEEKKISTVVDLGCGDFSVGRSLQFPGVKYIGIDIVDDVINRNRSAYAGPLVSFQVADVTTDELPDADLCLIRQVFQHLSNDEILRVLQKVKKYRYIAVTEHYPAPFVNVVANKDKPHGGDTRLYDNSAVYLDQPPFNLRISRVMLEMDTRPESVHPGETIKTCLLENW